MTTFTKGESFLALLNILPRSIYDAFPSVLFGRLLVLAVRTGLFETMASGPRAANAIAEELGFHPSANQLLLQSLAQAGYLLERDGMYGLAAQSRRWLLKASPRYIGDFLAYIELLHKRWDTLEQTLRNGHPPSTYFETFSVKEWRIYAAGMRSLARFLMPFVIGRIRLPDNARILDIGGSHGLYSIELCRRFPGGTAMIADLPDVLPYTMEVIHEHNMADSIGTLPIELRTGSLPNGEFDTVLLFNIIHGFDEEFNKTLASRVAATLCQSGTVYLLDQLAGEKDNGVAAFLPLMVGINLMNEAGGMVYTHAQVESWYRAAGFSRVKNLPLRLPGVSLLKIEK